MDSVSMIAPTKDYKDSATMKQEKLLKEAYELGFEVGYHRHSEIGWVRENFLKLQSTSKEFSMGNSVSLQYQKGKQEGVVAREKGLKIDSSTEVSRPCNKNDRDVVFNPSVKKDTFKSGFQSPSFDNTITSPVGKPIIMDLPVCTSLGKVIKRPSNIKGFRPLFPGNE